MRNYIKAIDGSFKAWIEKFKTEQPESYEKYRAKQRRAEKKRRDKPESKIKRQVWRKSVRGRIPAYKESAKKKGRVWELSDDEAALLLSDDCHYCGIAANPTNGIDRKDNNKGYHLNNSLSCCTMCNYAKRKSSYDEFIAWFDRAFEFRMKLKNRT